jgi:aspartyl-tRNA synthetase
VDQSGLARKGYTGPVHHESGALPADPVQRKAFWDGLTGKHREVIEKYLEGGRIDYNGVTATFADGTEIYLDDLDVCRELIKQIARMKNLEAQRDLWIVDEPHIEAAARIIKQDTFTRTLQTHSARTHPAPVDLKNRFAAPVQPR